MSLKEKFMKKLRSRIWQNSRSIVRLRKRALDAEKTARLALHSEIDDLKMEREQDVMKLEDLCREGDGILEEVKVGVEDIMDNVRHSRESAPE